MNKKSINAPHRGGEVAERQRGADSFSSYFTFNKETAEELVMAYPVELREDVMYTFISTVESRRYWLNVELSMTKKLVVTNVVLDDPNEYESTIRKLILLAYVDNKIIGYFTAVTHTNVVF